MTIVLYLVLCLGSAGLGSVATLLLYRRIISPDAEQIRVWFGDQRSRTTAAEAQADAARATVEQEIVPAFQKLGSGVRRLHAQTTKRKAR